MAVDRAADAVDVPGGFAALHRGAQLVAARPVALLVAIALTAMLVLPAATTVSEEALASSSILVPLVIVPVVLISADRAGVWVTLQMLASAFVASVVVSGAWLPAEAFVLVLAGQLLILPLAALPALRWQEGSWRAAFASAGRLLRVRWPSTIAAGVTLVSVTALTIGLPGWLLLDSVVGDSVAFAIVSSLGATVFAVAACGWASIAGAMDAAPNPVDD